MKKSIRLIGMLLSAAALTMFVACSDDDGPKIPDIGPVIDNGMYIIGTATSEDPGSSLLMTTGTVGDGEQRGNFFETYIYLSTGSFNYVNYVNNEPTVFGGTVTTSDMGTSSTFGEGDAVVDGAAISITEAGLYHLHIDLTTNTFYVTRVDYFEIIGSATEDGWGSGQELAEKSASADEVVFEGTDIVLRSSQSGEFKFRYNSAWGTDAANEIDLNIHSNFGANIVAGGPNIAFTEADGDGKYTVTVTYTPGPGPSLDYSFTFTGEVEEITFDPEEYTWGIIGGGTQGTETTAGWSDDKDLHYVSGDGGKYIWRGVFPLSNAADNNSFKFRTDDSWAKKLIPNTTVVTDNTEAGTISDDAATNADGQWFLDGPSGFYYFEIVTEDDGDSWSLTIDEASWGVIGDAANGWGDEDDVVMTYGDDLMTTAVTTNLVASGAFKFRVNASWDFNLGLDKADNTNPVLARDGDNITVAADGSYTITLKTEDGGATYTYTAE